MSKITTIEEGIRSIYRINEFGDVPTYSVVPCKEGEYTDHLSFDGKLYPIFNWRGVPAVASVANTARSGVGSCCSMKISGAISRDFGLDKFLYKELDTVEWALNSTIKHVTAFVNDKTCNAILRMKNDKVAILELGACLPIDADEQTRHTAWGTKGMVSDRVVSEKIRPQAVYLFNNGKTPTTYNDNMSALYGLNQDDCAKAVIIASMLLGRVNVEEWANKHNRLVKYIEAIYRSSETGERIDVSEVE